MDGAERAGLRRELLRQAWPLVLLNLSRTFMFFVDTALVGRLDEASLASMGVIGPISYTVLSVLTALSTGTLATVARAWGARDVPKQRRSAAAGLVLAAVVGLPLSLAGVLLLPEMARLFPIEGAPEATALARGYLRIEGAAFFFICLDLAASGILRGAGETRVIMAVSVGANAVNAVLDAVLIFGLFGAPRMGVVGAGLATASAQTLQAVVLVGVLWTRFSPLRLTWASIRAVDRPSLGRLARVTTPAVLEPMVLQSGFLAYTKIVTLLGATSLAAHRTALAVESLTFMGAYGFVMAGSALVGQTLGQGRPDLAAAALSICARTTAAVMSGMGVLFLAVPSLFVGIFVEGPELAEAAALAADCLRIAAVEQPFMGLAMALAAGLRGAGDTRSPVAVAVLGVWMVRVPLAWALAFPAGLGLHGIWITMIVDWAARTLILAVLVKRGRWKEIRL